MIIEFYFELPRPPTFLFCEREFQQFHILLIFNQSVNIFKRFVQEYFEFSADCVQSNSSSDAQFGCLFVAAEFAVILQQGHECSDSAAALVKLALVYLNIASLTQLQKLLCLLQ